SICDTYYILIKEKYIENPYKNLNCNG
ncbi:ACT domain-containing protein, partial [Clostridioides difficile]